MNRPHPAGPLARLSSLALALACLALPACGGAKNPVSGKVTYKGEPCKGALVVFHPVNDKSATAIRPSAVVGDDGTFTLTSDPKRPGDGAAPGEYVVAVVWNTPPKRQAAGMGGDESKGGEVDRLGGKYRNETVSKLRVTIKPGKNDLTPFDLD